MRVENCKRNEKKIKRIREQRKNQQERPSFFISIFFLFLFLFSQMEKKNESKSLILFSLSLISLKSLSSEKRLAKWGSFKFFLEKKKKDNEKEKRQTREFFLGGKKDFSSPSLSLLEKTMKSSSVVVETIVGEKKGEKRDKL